MERKQINIKLDAELAEKLRVAAFVTRSSKVQIVSLALQRLLPELIERAKEEEKE